MTESRISFKFSSPLIKQSIQTTISKDQMTEIHEAYLTYFESTLTAKNQRTHLPNLIHHLTKLPGFDRKKLFYLNMIFKLFAEMYRPIEGFLNYLQMRSLAEELGGMNKVFKPIEIANQHRLCAQLYVEQRYFLPFFDIFLYLSKITW
jgi:hypothetical protein